MVQPSVKEQIVLAAERLFAEHGLDGVSLRQISAAAGNGNNTAVQYHFGTKEHLVQEIFEYRLPELNERRRLLVARRRPDDLRTWVECHLLPVLEQGEQEGSHYLSFVAMLQQHGRRDVFERLSAELGKPTNDFVERIGTLLPHLPEPLRGHRISQALAFGVHAASERERTRARGGHVLSFAVHVGDLLDGLVGFLQAPVSSTTSSVIGETETGTGTGAGASEPALPLHP
ncbi:TetR/AcrR family transcriptional regulator [Streptomyces sp. NPDC013157]|uniref:TetR/AcrR family transcriptional regulator n=1 Tax=Streptomyces sp. NPDC013157 TaxID=3364861 RepID=UPI0036A9C3F0